MRLKPFLLLKNEDLTSGNQISPKQNKSLFCYTRNVFKDLPTLAQTHETGGMQTITHQWNATWTVMQIHGHFQSCSHRPYRFSHHGLITFIIKTLIIHKN